MTNDLRVGSWTVRACLNTFSQNGISLRLEPEAMEELVGLASCPGEPVPNELRSTECFLKSEQPELRCASLFSAQLFF